jgi:hypothetical protein
MKQLRVSDNQRYLVYEDGEPFFYLADTAWELFHRLDQDAASQYLEDRAAKGFSVIQAVVLAELDGLHTPNPYGHLPFLEDNPASPAHFKHVDWIVDRAEALGLYIGMLPTWGDKWYRAWGIGPEIFNPKNAFNYGAWIAARYAEKPIIWILGGDRTAETEVHTATIRAMAAGIRHIVGDTQLISYHPGGSHSYSSMFHAEGWLDFNMVQSSHVRPHTPNYAMLTADYLRHPVKPCMDAEPCYEDHPLMGPGWVRQQGGWYDDLAVRQTAYWALFAGAHGHTYGCHPVWQMYHPDVEPINAARRPWYEAIHLPGACQMQYLRKLIESRPFLTRIPDQAMILSDPGEDDEHLQSTRNQEGTYALVYFPQYREATLDLGQLQAEVIRVSLYNPRNGKMTFDANVKRSEPLIFAPPRGGPDWVLVLDAVSDL